MNLERKLELLDQQITEAQDGHPDDLTRWRDLTTVILGQIFGKDSDVSTKFNEVRYTPSAFVLGTDFTPHRIAGVRRGISLLEAAKFELQLQEESVIVDSSSFPVVMSDQVFIVHGQDNARKFELSSLLQNLTSKQPMILHQLPNEGRGVIEKFEAHAGTAGYAVVLLTGDDYGRSKQSAVTDDQLRARQNVIFEMGFFFGKIGRARVAVLYEDGVELPSDIHGIVYIPIDAGGGWKSKLASELNIAGIAVKWTALGTA